MATFVLGLALLLAFANGANDNSKGVATLVGHGAAGPRAALAWAALTTALGAWTGGIVGAGLARAPGTVRWGVVREIAFSWIVTLPVAAAGAAVAAGIAAALRNLLTD